MDIRDEIDRSFGAGPEPGSVDALVADGRRALRRRRAATGAAALAIVLVAGGTTWAVAGSGPQARGADPSVATDTSPGPSEEEHPAAAHQAPATYDSDGTLVLQDGVTVLRRVDNPMKVEPPKRSVGLVLDDDGKKIWMLIESDLGGGFSILDDAHRSATTFDDWLREVVAENQPDKVHAPVAEQPASYAGDGSLVLRDGVTILRKVENPTGVEPPAQSVGLVLDDRGTRIWMLLESDPHGTSSTSDDAGKAFPTFELWLADQIALQQGTQQLTLVAFGDGETLVPDDGVEMVEQRPSPTMPADFASPRDRTAVAEVRWNGDLWFVLARQIQGSAPQYLPTAASAADGATTIDGFLEYARSQYAPGGSGLR